MPHPPSGARAYRGQRTGRRNDARHLHRLDHTRRTVRTDAQRTRHRATGGHLPLGAIQKRRSTTPLVASAADWSSIRFPPVQPAIGNMRDDRGCLALEKMVTRWRIVDLGSHKILLR